MTISSKVSAPRSPAEWGIFTTLVAIVYVTMMISSGDHTISESVVRGGLYGTTMALVVTVVVFAWRGLKREGPSDDS